MIKFLFTLIKSFFSDIIDFFSEFIDIIAFCLLYGSIIFILILSGFSYLLFTTILPNRWNFQGVKEVKAEKYEEALKSFD